MTPLPLTLSQSSHKSPFFHHVIFYAYQYINKDVTTTLLAEGTLFNSCLARIPEANSSVESWVTLIF